MTVDNREAANLGSTEGPFYLIQHSYIGPNDDAEEVLQETWEISTEPGLTNRSQEPKITGWLGSSGDWSLDAHGEFATIDDARAYIAKHVGGLVPMENDEMDLGEDVVEVYRAHLETIVVSVNGWWGSCDADYFGITANTTDERIAEIAEAELDEATIRIKSEEGNLPLFDGDLEARIIGLRDGLREKPEEDDE